MTVATPSTGAAPRPGPPGFDWQSALASAGRRVLAVEGLDVLLPGGRRIESLGRRRATLHLRAPGAVTAFVGRDQMGLFEAFMASEADAVPEPGDDEAAAFLHVVRALDEQWRDYRLLSAAVHSSRYFWQQTTEARRRKLAVHYSIPEGFWLAFMSPEYPIYSHYLFEEDETHEAWERACLRKLRFAFDACRMRAGQRVLNIGEGWGGWMTYAGRRGIRATGLTLNEDSYAACLCKREREGLSGTCDVIRTDFYHYHPDEPFDAITNMGVTEHLTDYDGLMARYARLLRSGGHVYSDFVGTHRDAPFRSMIQKHVYPGAAAVYLPKLAAAAARSGQLDVVEVHDDRLSYDRTCEAWARNCEKNRDDMVAHFGERRYRWMWGYLWMCVHGFRTYDNGITGTRVVLRRR